jgi:hypothetical protein
MLTSIGKLVSVVATFVWSIVIAFRYAYSALTITGNKKIAAKIKMTILKYDLDSDFILQSSI